MKEKLQMVDDDQVENVGIMSGFMDEIDELLEEISGEEEEEGDDADHDEVLEGDEHVQLEPDAVVGPKDGAQAEVESDAGG